MGLYIVKRYQKGCDQDPVSWINFDRGHMFCDCASVMVVYMLSSLIKENIKKLSEGKKDIGERVHKNRYSVTVKTTTLRTLYMHMAHHIPKRTFRESFTQIHRQLLFLRNHLT